MILAHKIRLDPTPRQEDYFRRACGTARFTYNWALSAWKASYDAGDKPSGRSLKKQFNAVRSVEYPWTRKVHRDCTARPFDNLQNAFQHFFRRVKAGEKPGYPQFKKKGKCKDGFYIACDKVQFSSRHVRVPVLGWVKMREPLRFAGKVLGVTVSRTADRWDIAVQVDVGEVHKNRSADGVVGVDLGIKTSGTLSTGEKIEGPKALRTNLKKLKWLSRRHSRKVKGSSGRKKSAMRLARLHARIANVRKDYLDKLSTLLCKNHAAIGIEDLYVQGMVLNRKLSRAISDEGWGQFRWMLSYKSLLYGTKIVVADRWFPSSKTCSDCCHVVEKLPLGIREWACPVCGVVHDRDVNAAKNLEPDNVPGGTGELTLVEIAALANPYGSVKLRSSKPESSSRSPQTVAV